MNTSFTLLSELPDGFTDLRVENILELFPNPTLIKLDGDKKPPLFVSILLHGNEFSGFNTIQALLKKYPDRLPRSLYVFIGNVSAAARGLRVIPGQTDFNRCWPGTEMLPNDETRMMQQLVELVTEETLFAAIDLHNNSGINPHYACITDVTQDNQQLASMFNHIGLVFKRPKGVSTMAFENICPAATLECGRPGDEAGIHHATELLDALLHMDHLPQRPVARHDLQLVHSFATLNIPQNVSLGFDLSKSADLTFDANFERLNFTEMNSNDVFAHTRIDKPLSISNQDGEDITDQLMRVENGKVYLNQTLMPAMITTNEAIIRQDCLCYLLVDYQSRPA